MRKELGRGLDGEMNCMRGNRTYFWLGVMVRFIILDSVIYNALRNR